MEITNEMWDQMYQAVNDPMFEMAAQTLKKEEKQQINQYVRDHWEKIKANKNLLMVISAALEKLANSEFSSFTQKQAEMIMPKAYKTWKKQIPDFDEMLKDDLMFDLMKVIKEFQVMSRIKTMIEGDLNVD